MTQRLVVPSMVAGALILQMQFAFAGTTQITQDFEITPTPGWFTDGNGAGFDFGKGSAHQGQGNAWVGRAKGPDAINTWLDIPKFSFCSLRAWIKLSPDFTDGSMYVRGGDGKIFGSVIKDLKLPQIRQLYQNPTDYNSYHFDFNTGPDQKILFTIETNGKDENSWELIDDLEVSCKAPS